MDEQKPQSNFQIQIGGNLESKQIAIGDNIQQTGDQIQPVHETSSDTSPADANYELPFNRALVAQLRHGLNTHFSEDELKDMALDLGVDYESLPGSGKAAKGREMVLHLARAGRLPELLSLCQQWRPSVQWPDV